jgi:hypothetical protein
LELCLIKIDAVKRHLHFSLRPIGAYAPVGHFSAF